LEVVWPPQEKNARQAIERNVNEKRAVVFERISNLT